MAKMKLRISAGSDPVIAPVIDKARPTVREMLLNSMMLFDSFAWIVAIIAQTAMMSMVVPVAVYNNTNALTGYRRGSVFCTFLLCGAYRMIGVTIARNKFIAHKLYWSNRYH